MPKFMLLVRATREGESGTPPPTERLDEMMVYNTELVQAGVMVAGEGLLPSARGARVSFDAPNAPAVTNGPFAPDTTIGGFWIITAANLQEAVGWAKKAPFREPGSAVEVRQVAGADDFGDQMTDELRQKEDELRKNVAERIAGSGK